MVIKVVDFHELKETFLFLLTFVCVYRQKYLLVSTFLDIELTVDFPE